MSTSPVEEARKLAVEVGMRSPDYSQLALDYVRRHLALG